MSSEISGARAILCRSAVEDVSGLSLFYLGLLARLARVEQGEGSFDELRQDALRGAEETAFVTRLLDLEAAKLPEDEADPRQLIRPLRLIGESMTLLATAASAEDAQVRPLASVEEIEALLKLEPTASLMRAFSQT